jgi:hypothetical protein
VKRCNCSCRRNGEHINRPAAHRAPPRTTGVRCGGALFVCVICLTLLGVCGPHNQGEHNCGSVAPWLASFGPR